MNKTITVAEFRHLAGLVALEDNDPGGFVEKLTAVVGHCKEVSKFDRGFVNPSKLVQARVGVGELRPDIAMASMRLEEFVSPWRRTSEGLIRTARVFVNAS